ncbi:MAG TPA: polysaccharide biosynthesis tyrosine autokinase [Acidimicrobiales bacterium]|nr:polysaccharide biosynthesis tyrosine autokinase [Acidimicrobiales bacterium]
MESSNQFVDVRRSIRILLANSWIVLLAVVILSVLTYVWSSSKPKLFQSGSLVRVYNPKDDLSSSSNNGQRVDPEREVDIQVLYANSPDVIAEFTSALGDDAKKVESHSVKAVANADAIQLTVQSKNKQFAQIAARVYTNTYVEQQRASIAQRYGDQAAALRKQAATLDTQIAQLDAQIAATGGSRVVTVGGRPVVLPESQAARNLDDQRTSLTDQRTKLLSDADALDIERSARQSDIEIIKPPKLPSAPSSPLPNRDAAVGGLVGLFLGLGIAVFRYRLGDHITTSDELAAMLGPGIVTTSIPSYRSSTGRAAHELAHIGGPPRVLESYRILRAELMFATSNQTPFCLLVSSARGSEGKTTVASNLAVSFATAGVRVALVDADLRHGRVHDVFELSNQTGLSQLRRKGFELARAMQRKPIDGAPLDVLTNGPTPQNPAELLLNPSALSVIAELKKHYQYVIIDGPPVLPVADALHLARAADGVLLVGRANSTQFASFRAALERFRQSSARIIGAVLVDVEPERGDDKYYYSYVTPEKGATAPQGGSKRKGGQQGNKIDFPTLPAPPMPAPQPGRPEAEPQPVVYTAENGTPANVTDFGDPDVVSLGAPPPSAPPPGQPTPPPARDQ